MIFPALVVIGCATAQRDSDLNFDRILKEDCERWRTYNAKGVFTRERKNLNGDSVEIRCATACVPFGLEEGAQESSLSVAGTKLMAYIAEKQGTDPETTLVDTIDLYSGASHCEDERTLGNQFSGMYTCAEVCENPDNYIQRH